LKYKILLPHRYTKDSLDMFLLLHTVRSAKRFFLAGSHPETICSHQFLSDFDIDSHNSDSFLRLLDCPRLFATSQSPSSIFSLLLKTCAIPVHHERSTRLELW